MLWNCPSFLVRSSLLLTDHGFFGRHRVALAGPVGVVYLFQESNILFIVVCCY